jgi:hypothetical protein
MVSGTHVCDCIIREPGRVGTQFVPTRNESPTRNVLGEAYLSITDITMAHGLEYVGRMGERVGTKTVPTLHWIVAESGYSR